jgi:uncharacterized protein YjiS (DUF1127 family)
MMALVTDRILNGAPADYRTVVSDRSLWIMVGTTIGKLVTTLFVWQERAHQRRKLLALSDRALQDFGRCPADAAVEGDKPFWRA